MRLSRCLASDPRETRKRIEGVGPRLPAASRSRQARAAIATAPSAAHADGGHALRSSVLPLIQRLPRRALRRVPRRPLPPSPRGARGRVFHPRRVESAPPPLLVVPGKLEVVALARHADRDAADTGPGVEPSPERPERAVIRGHGARGASDGCPEEA